MEPFEWGSSTTPLGEPELVHTVLLWIIELFFKTSFGQKDDQIPPYTIKD